MKHSLESPSVPMTAMPLGTSGSSISERITRNAPPSAHEKDVRPWSILPGSIGWDPTVDQSPIRKARGCSAGFGMQASCAIGVGIEDGSGNDPSFDDLVMLDSPMVGHHHRLDLLRHDRRVRLFAGEPRDRLLGSPGRDDPELHTLRHASPENRGADESGNT